MNIIIPLLISFLAGISTILGTIPIFIKIKPINIDKFIVLCLSLSGVIMLGISIIDLIPCAIISLNKTNPLYLIILIISVQMILCYILFDKVLHKYDVKEKGSSLYKLGILNMIILIIHNIPEGIITYLSGYKNIKIGIKMGLAIMMHNIPEGIAIAVPVYYSTNNKKKAFIYTIISGMSEFLGALLSMSLIKKLIYINILDIILLYVGILMIFLVIEKIYPEIREYNNTKYSVYGIIMGLICLLISLTL